MTVPSGLSADGFGLFPDFVGAAAQRALLDDVRAVVAAAPLYTPGMPRSGKTLSVRMTNCGPLGWYTDRENGYRYVDRHPETGDSWPPMPESVLAIWRAVAPYEHPPEACLVNYYDADARLGLHRDQDEDAADAPVVSISLGDTALFRVGGPTRRDATRSLRLASGAVVVLAGQARQWFHGVDRILSGSSRLLAEGGRFNLTLRRVTRPGG